MTQRDKKAIELDKVLYILADNALCPENKERLCALVPSIDTETVREELHKTNAATSLLQLHSNPRYGAALGALEAVERAQKGGLLSMGELLHVRRALQNFRELALWFELGEDGVGAPLQDLFATLSAQPALENNIATSILSESEMADTASDALYSIRRQIRVAQASIRDKLDGIIKSSTYQKYLQEAVVTMRGGRFVVPVKAEFRGEVPGTLHDVSSSGSTLFVEPSAVVEAGSKVMQLRNSEAEEITRILEAFTQQVASIAPFFAPSYEAMLEIDRILAKAKLALQQNAFMPLVENEKRFNLVRARHPLISKDIIVPIDIQLGYDYDALIITGPNTGGKTVTLKTAGLLCAMACCGMLLPAGEGSSVCVFSEILADIGDEQSIEQSLSTFSGHMRNITQILQTAGENSLVLLDELGAGTDPAEGAALAVAIIESLRSANVKLLATTHYAELKVYALETARVQNASCEFDVQTLRPTYRLVVGVPGRSNAFAIGRRLGIPDEVIARAQGHLSAEDKRFETVLGQLDDIKKELAISQEETRSLENAAQIALESAQQERDALIAQGEKELEQARARAGLLAEQVQNEAYRLMDEMKALQKQEKLAAAEKARRARQIALKDAGAISAFAGEGEAQVSVHPPLTSVKLGDKVVVTAGGREGVVTATTDKNGMVEVRLGNMRTRVPLSGLHAPAAGGEKRKKMQPRKGEAGTGKAPARSAAHEINLLGRTVEEAIMEADMFIDGAVMSGIPTVYIIHGIGTGALRTGLHAHFKNHKSIKSFRLGRYGEGEAGVTVVDLQ